MSFGEWLAMAGPIAAILTILGAIFNFSVIKPLNGTIRALDASIENLQRQLHEVEEKRESMAIRLATVESSVKSAHHRLDEIWQRINAGR